MWRRNWSYQLACTYLRIEALLLGTSHPLISLPRNPTETRSDLFQLRRRANFTVAGQPPSPCLSGGGLSPAYEL